MKDFSLFCSIVARNLPKSSIKSYPEFFHILKKDSGSHLNLHFKLLLCNLNSACKAHSGCEVPRRPDAQLVDLWSDRIWRHFSALIGLQETSQRTAFSGYRKVSVKDSEGFWRKELIKGTIWMIWWGPREPKPQIVPGKRLDCAVLRVLGLGLSSLALGVLRGDLLWFLSSMPGGKTGVSTGKLWNVWGVQVVSGSVTS